MTCICCCGDRDRYLENKEKVFGQDVINTYKYSTDYKGCRTREEIKGRCFSYFDRSPEALEFHKRYIAFFKSIEEDTKNFCKRKNK